MQVGDIVRGISDDYLITNTKMRRGVVVDFDGETIMVRVLEHETEYYASDPAYSGPFEVDPSKFMIIDRQKPFDRKEWDSMDPAVRKAALREYNLRDADLRIAHLNDADLRAANLYRADLSTANLSTANLSAADLRAANLSAADLSAANLNDANLRAANLSDASLYRADLRGADLRDANLRAADLRGADLDFSCWPLWRGSLGVIVDKRIASQLAYHFCSLRLDDPEYIAARNAILGFANQFHSVEECGRLEPIETRTSPKKRPPEEENDGMPLTKEELAEIARADAEIEATFVLTETDLELDKYLDELARQQLPIDPEIRKSREAARRRYAANPEKAKEAARRRYAANPEKAKEDARRWREANPEKAKEAVRRWREEHRAEYNAYQREYQREYQRRKRKAKKETI